MERVTIWGEYRYDDNNDVTVNNDVTENNDVTVNNDVTENNDYYGE